MRENLEEFAEGCPPASGGIECKPLRAGWTCDFGIKDDGYVGTVVFNGDTTEIACLAG